MNAVKNNEVMNVTKKASELEIWQEFAKMFKTSETFQVYSKCFKQHIGEN